MNFIKKNRYLFFSLIITIFVMLYIFFINGMYPFGKNIFSIMDFDHAYVPVYYKLWDILHGKSTFLFDWNLGGGLNSFGSLIGNSLLSPSSWIIALFKRDFIPYAMSFVLIFKMVEVSLFTYISLDKIYPKVKGFYKMIFTIIYTWCGWTMFMISSLLYLDVFAIFPLFVLAYYKLMKDNKWGMYVIVLTICLMFSYYMSYLILFFIIGITIISLCILDIKDKKKKAVEVVLLTLVSLGISCIVFLPAFYQAKTSTRMAAASDFNSTFLLGETLLMILYLFPLVIPIFYTFKQLFVKKDKRNNLFFGLLLLYLLIGIFIPKINAMWHTGSYSGLPFRYSFIPSFVIILIAMYYINNNYKEKKNKNNLINIISSIILIVLIIVFGCIFRKDYVGYNFVNEITILSQFVCALLLFVMSFLSMFIILKNSKIIRNVFITVLSLVNICIYSSYFIISNIEETSIFTNDINNKFKLPKDGYYYITNIGKLSPNFPYILDVPSMQNRIHFIKDNEYKFMNAFGYHSTDTFMYAHGGNMLSNLLMQNKYYLSLNKLNNKLYKLIAKQGDYYLYEAKYNLKYVTPYNGKKYNSFSLDVVSNTNNVYKKLFDMKEDIMHIISDKVIDISPDNIYYFYLEKDTYQKFIKNISYDKTEYRYDYIPTPDYDVLIIDSDKKLKIDIKDLKVRSSYINIDEYVRFINSINDYEASYKINGNKRIYKIKINKEKSVLLPINYDKGFNIRVNNKNVKCDYNVYNMLSVKLDKGENIVEVLYIPHLLKEGIIISIVSLLVMLFFIITNKFFNYLSHKFILYPLFGITFMIGLVFLLRIYVFFWLF